MRFLKVPLLFTALVGLSLSGCGGSNDCSTGLTSCGGTCVDLSVDNANCGACGTACGTFTTCGAATCAADPQLDVGTFGSNFQATTLTRGYWFTAPVAFTITGLRVPTDVGTDVQNIEVVRLAAAPPSYSTVTNTFTSLGRFVNVIGTDFIAVNIPVAAGNIIGILGARGTTTMNNSYGTTNTYATTIAGTAVTLQRLGMQYNLNSTPAKDLWTESVNPVSRIEMYYR